MHADNERDVARNPTSDPASPNGLGGGVLALCAVLVSLGLLGFIRLASSQHHATPRLILLLALIAVPPVFVGYALWSRSYAAFRALKLLLSLLLGTASLTFLLGILLSTTWELPLPILWLFQRGEDAFAVSMSVFLFAGPWWVYLNRSRRVRNTFPPTEELYAETGDSESPEERLREFVSSSPQLAWIIH